MKIALVTEVLSVSSGARAPIGLALGISQVDKRADLTVIAHAKGADLKLKKFLERQKIKVILINGSQIHSAARLYFVLKKLKPEAITFHGTLFFLIASRLVNVPLVKTYHGTQFNAYLERFFPQKPDFWQKLLNFLINNLVVTIEKFQFYIADKTVAISEYTKDEVARIYHQKIEFIYQGGLFEKPKDSPKKGSYILSVSRFTPYKNFHKLIEQSKGFPLIIAGKSQNKNYLNYLKKIRGNNCKILADVSEEKLASLYKNCLFYATFDKYPFFGMTIVEASVFQKPSIALNLGAVPELIKNNKTGYIINKPDEEFRKLAAKLFKNPLLARKLGLAAQKFTEKFNWENTAKQHLKILKKTIVKDFFFLKVSPLILLGLSIRLLFLGKHSFWYDESFAYYIASSPLQDFLQLLKFDNNPPVFYLILKLWSQISTDVAFLRLLSLILGVASIPLFYSLSKKLVTKRFTTPATLLFSISPLLVYFSTETRGYSLATFELLLAVWLFLEWLKSGKKLLLNTLTTVSIISLYTHYYLFLIMLALNFNFFKNLKKNSQYLRAWIVSQIFIVGSFIPWLLFISPNRSISCWCFKTFQALPATLVAYTTNGVGVITQKRILTQLPIHFAIFFLASIYILFLFLRGIRKSSSLVLSFFLVPLLTISIIGLFWPIFSPRAMIIIAPFYYMIVAVGLASIKNRLLIYLTYSAFIFILLINYFSPFYFGPDFQKAAQIAKSSTNSIVVHLDTLSVYPFKYYQKNNSRNYLVSDNIPPILESTNNEDLANALENKDKVWLVFLTDYGDDEKLFNFSKMLKNNYILSNQIEVKDITLYHYDPK